MLPPTPRAGNGPAPGPLPRARGVVTAPASKRPTRSKPRGEPMILADDDAIVTAYAESAAGPGWANSPIWVIVRRRDGNLRMECLQPDEQTRDNPNGRVGPSRPGCGFSIR